MAVKKAYAGAILAVVINSFISTFLSMILKTGMDSSVVTFYRLIIVSAIMLPLGFSKSPTAKMSKASRRAYGSCSPSTA